MPSGNTGAELNAHSKRIRTVREGRREMGFLTARGQREMEGGGENETKKMN